MTEIQNCELYVFKNHSNDIIHFDLNYLIKNKHKLDQFFNNDNIIIPESIKDIVNKTFRKCHSCNKYHFLTKEFFHKNKTCKYGFSYECKKCVKERNKWFHKLKTYNISKEEFMQMFNDQDGKCDICGKDFNLNDHNNIHIDHDHDTNKIRGLLCNNCNALIAHAKENPLTLAKAIKYIENENGDDENE